MRSIILFFTFIGVILITVGYVKTNMKCPPPLVKFKYISKTFDEEQNNPLPITNLVGKMFSEDSPWVSTHLNYTN
jgi:hypothetical protein